MKIKAIDGLQFAVGLALVAAGASKVPGADVLMRQLDLVGLALFYRLRGATLATVRRTRCVARAGFGITALLLVSVVVAAAMAQNARLGVGLLAPLALLALGETVISARLRRAADDLRDSGVADSPCKTC